MDALERARIALRKHILENKEKVAADLEEMRRKSEGNDIYSYINNLSKSMHIGEITSENEIIFSYDVSTDIPCYQLNKRQKYFKDYIPPDLNKTEKKSKKDSEKNQGLFFLLILYHGKGRTSSVFV